MPDMKMPGIKDDRTSMDLLLDIPLQLSVELGRRRMPIAEVLQLGPGSVVELTKAAGESLDIYVNDRLVAKGEAVMVGERYGVRITEIQNPNERARQVSNAEELL
jgi:flagellar motor switch protein FliN/FliY